MQSKYIIFFIYFCFARTVLLAQPSQLRAYTIADGLPQSQIYDLEQDEQGYLWIATYGAGLCRFDGEQFEVWNHKQQLASNFVNAITNRNDSLFVATKKGLSIKTDKEFVTIEGPELLELYEFDEVLYCATTKGLFVYKNKELLKFTLHTEIDQSSINDLVFDGKYYWLATNKGLWRLGGLDANSTDTQKITSNDFIALVYADPYVFAATYDDGTLVFDRNGNHHDPILIREPLRISDMALVEENELWIATDNAGITIIDVQTYNEKGQINRKNGLQVSNVKKIIPSLNGATWITTLGGGYYKYFQNNFTHYDRDTGLRSNRIEAVHATKDAVWIANTGAKLGYIDGLGIHQIVMPSHFWETKITAITSDAENRIWVGTDSRGIMLRAKANVYEFKNDSTFVDSILGFQIRIDTLVQNVTKNYVVDRSKGLHSDRIQAVETSADGTIWAATYAKGITHFSYDVEKDSVRTLQNYGVKEGLRSMTIRVMKKDGLGTLWYGTNGGHLGYIKKNSLKHLGIVTPQKQVITSLCFDAKNIFIGTAGDGIWWASLNDPSDFQRLVGQEQAYSDTTNQLLFDDQGALWIGTELGLDKITLDQGYGIVNVAHFSKEDGFFGVETIPNAMAKDANGALWFGANNGLTKYHPGTILRNSKTGKLHFEEVQVGYQSLDTLDLKKWTSIERILPLTSEQTQLSFVYKMVDVDHPKAVQYRFQLNNGTWSPWGADNKQNFSGLRYGKHIFQVQARNFRLEITGPIRFQFLIATPWYNKPWFPWSMALIVTAVISMIVVLYALTEKQKAKIAVEEKGRLLNKNKVLELEQKALRLQMNPHFIFNVLNGIKAMGISNPQKMNTTINTFAALLRETLYNSRKEKITLDQEIKTIRNYITVEQLMTKKEFHYELTTELEMAPEELLIPPMLVQPFVENAIRHGVLKGNNKGVLKLHFYTKEAFLFGEITDNGIGIFTSQNAKKKTDHQSVALKVTRERLESISGKGALTIKELKNKDQIITGTQVVFKIPLETDF